jgi:hypothetical protein
MSHRSKLQLIGISCTHDIGPEISPFDMLRTG